MLPSNLHKKATLHQITWGTCACPSTPTDTHPHTIKWGLCFPEAKYRLSYRNRSYIWSALMVPGSKERTCPFWTSLSFLTVFSLPWVPAAVFKGNLFQLYTKLVFYLAWTTVGLKRVARQRQTSITMLWKKQDQRGQQKGRYCEADTPQFENRS